MGRGRVSTIVGGIPVRVLLVFWLFVLSAVAFLDRTNISIAGVEMARAYRLDDVHFGWILSAFLTGYALFQVVGGLLAERFGPRRTLALGVVWWGIFTALTALVPPAMHGALLALLTVRFALGAGEAIVYPASNQFVARWLPRDERGRANGLIFAGVGASAGLTPPLLRVLISHCGWRASFWSSAVIGVFAGVVWYWAARDTPERHPWVHDAELGRIQGGRRPDGHPGGTGTAQSVNSLSPSPQRVSVNREVAALTLSYFAFGYVAWIFFSWFYIYLAKVRGLNLQTSAVYAMFPFLAMTGCCLLGGAASDWLVRHFGLRAGRCGLSVGGMGLTAVFLILGAKAQSALVASVMLAGGAGALYLSQSCFWAVAADIAGNHSGRISGVMNMGAQIGGAVTATLTPFIAARFGWAASFEVAALLALAGALLWLPVDPECKTDKRLTRTCAVGYRGNLDTDI
jgi:MFS transporter, ACS family, glucarate transporter